MSQGTALQTIDGKVFFYCIRVDTVRPRPFRVDDDKCDCLDGDTDATADRVLRLLATAVVGHVLCVCVFCDVLHIKPFFLPVDIQHNQCPCRLFNPRAEIQVMWSQNYATEILQQLVRGIQ